MCGVCATIPLLSLPKPLPHQSLTQIRTPISRPASNPGDNTPVPSHGGSLGRRSAAAAGADGAGATRSRIPKGVACRGDARSSRVESRTAEGGGVDTRTGPGGGRCHPCPPCAEGPLANSEAHSPRMWKPVRAERQPSSKRYKSKLTGRRPGAPPTPPSPRPVRQAGRQRAQFPLLSSSRGRAANPGTQRRRSGAEATSPPLDLRRSRQGRAIARRWVPGSPPACAGLAPG